jgi:hypothetical protein
MCVRVRGVNFFSLSTIFLLDFGTVPTVRYVPNWNLISDVFNSI